MITHKELKKNAFTRLKDSRILYREARYDSAIYLCGYAIELILKAVICKKLELKGIPNTSQEFTTIGQLKTHNLESLLSLIDQEIKLEIKNNYFNDWGVVLEWDPELRYTPIVGTPLKADTKQMIKSSTIIYRYLKDFI